MYLYPKEENIMNQTEIGIFIARCRKEQKLTQAQLAEKLNITDRAVSKWETGKSMPDSSIMLDLCAILGITVNELLSGEKIEMKPYEKSKSASQINFTSPAPRTRTNGEISYYTQKAEENLLALKQQEENSLSKNRILAILFSAACFLGIAVCLICDIATAGRLTWSLIPLGSIAFAWVVSFPAMIMGKKGILGSLVSLSIFIIPYLYLLSFLLKVHAVFSIGTAIAVPAILFLWLMSAIFARMGRTRRLLALGISLLAAVPLVFLINLILSRMINEPLLDVWDGLTVFLLLVLSFASLTGNYLKKKNGKSDH